MKKLLENFYNDNKAAFEIAGILLIITGLILNIPATNGWVGKSLNQLEFFLLLASDIAVIYLLIITLQSFLLPFLEKEDESTDQQTVHGLKKTIKFLLQKILVATFFILIGFLFAFNLVIYLIFSHPRESIFLAITLFCYLLILKFSVRFSIPTRPLSERWHTHLWTIFLFLFSIGIPIISYFFLYLDLPITIYYLGVSIAISFLISITIYLLILR